MALLPRHGLDQPLQAHRIVDCGERIWPVLEIGFELAVAIFGEDGGHRHALRGAGRLHGLNKGKKIIEHVHAHGLGAAQPRRPISWPYRRWRRRARVEQIELKFKRNDWRQAHGREWRECPPQQLTHIGEMRFAVEGESFGLNLRGLFSAPRNWLQGSGDRLEPHIRVALETRVEERMIGMARGIQHQVCGGGIHALGGKPLEIGRRDLLAAKNPGDIREKHFNSLEIGIGGEKGLGLLTKGRKLARRHSGQATSCFVHRQRSLAEAGPVRLSFAYRCQTGQKAGCRLAASLPPLQISRQLEPGE